METLGRNSLSMFSKFISIEKNIIYNGQKISRYFDILLSFSFATSETERGAEQFKAMKTRILKN